MDIQFIFSKVNMFCPLFPTQPPSCFFLLHPHLGHLCGCRGVPFLAIWDHLKSQKGFLGVGRRIGDVVPTWGGVKTFWHLPIFCIIIIGNAFKFEDSR